MKSIALLLKYGVSGLLSLGTSLVFLYIFTELLHMWYLIGAVCAFVPAFLVSFSLQKFWTFENQSRVDIRAQIIKYAVTIFSALLLNMLLLYLLVEHVRLHYIIAQFISGIAIAIYNFLFYRYIVFKN